MWVLEVPKFFHESGESYSHIEKLVLPNKTYVVGRSESVEICVRNPLNPHLVSERQFSFTTQPSFNQNATPITITVMGRAKMIINDTEKFKPTLPDNPTIKKYEKVKELKINIGSSKKGFVKLRFKWVDMNFAFSKDDLIDNVTIHDYLTQKFSRDYFKIINFDTMMNDSTTHFLKTDKLSTKVALALIRNLKIVNINFIDELVNSFYKKVNTFDDILTIDDLHVQNRKLPDHLSMMEYDYLRFFPRYTDYLPDKDFLPNPTRKTIFSNSVFIVTSRVQFDNLQDVIEKGSGQLQLFDLSKQFKITNENYKDQIKVRFKKFVKEFIYYLKELTSNAKYSNLDLLIFKNITIDTSKKYEALNYEILKKTSELLNFQLFTNKNFFDVIKDINPATMNNFKINKKLLSTIDKHDYFSAFKSNSFANDNEQKNDIGNGSNQDLGSYTEKSISGRPRRSRTTNVAKLFSHDVENSEPNKIQTKSPIVHSKLIEDSNNFADESSKLVHFETGMIETHKKLNDNESLFKSGLFESSIVSATGTSQSSIRRRRQRKSTVDSLFGIDGSIPADPTKSVNSLKSIAIPEEEPMPASSSKLEISSASHVKEHAVDMDSNVTTIKEINKSDISSIEKKNISENEQTISLEKTTRDKNESHLKQTSSAIENPDSQYSNSSSKGKINIVTAIQKAKTLEENRIKKDLGDGETDPFLTSEELERIKGRLKIEPLQPLREKNNPVSDNNMAFSLGLSRPSKNFKTFVKILPKRSSKEKNVCDDSSGRDHSTFKRYISYKVYDPAEDHIHNGQNGEDEFFIGSKMRMDNDHEKPPESSSNDQAPIENAVEQEDRNEYGDKSRDSFQKFQFSSDIGSKSANDNLFVVDSDDEEEQSRITSRDTTTTKTTETVTSNNKRKAVLSGPDSCANVQQKHRRFEFSNIRNNAVSAASEDEDENEELIPKFKFST